MFIKGPGKIKKLVLIALAAFASLTLSLMYGSKDAHAAAGYVTGKFNKAYDFNGQYYVDAGNVGTGVKSAAFWLKGTAGGTVLDFNGSDYISISGGTVSATGFSATIYVDGEVGSTVDSNWHYVVVTTSESLDGSAVKFGSVESNNLVGQMDDVKLYNYALSAREIAEKFRGDTSSLASGGTIDGNLYIMSSGSLNIGSTSPIAKLDVAGTAWLRGADASQGLYIDTSGNVGIGTTNPTGKLQVVGDEVRIGDAGTVGYASADGDLYVEDALEVDGQCVTGDTLLPIVAENGYMVKWLNGYMDEEAHNPSLTIQPFNHSAISYTPIKDIKGGEYVLSLNEQTGQIEPHRIKGLLDMGVKPVYKLTTEDGRTIRTTGNHPYLAKDGWKKVIQIKEGEEIAVLRQEESLFLGLSSFVDAGKGEKKENEDNNAASDVEEKKSNVSLVKAHDSIPFADASATSQEPALSINPKTNTAIFGLSSDGKTYGMTIDPKNNVPRLINKSESLSSWDPEKVGFRSSRINTSFGIHDDLITTEESDVKRAKRSPAPTEGLVLGFAKVTSIEFVGYEQVYDIEVEGTHNFVAGHFVRDQTSDSGEKTSEVSEDLTSEVSGAWFGGIIAHNTYLAGATSLIFGGTTSLGETTSATDSGAYLVGLYDDAMAYIAASTTVQGAIKELDTAIGTVSGSAGGWTDGGSSVYLTVSADNVGIGTSTPLNKLDVSGSVAFGSLPTTALPQANSAYFSGNVGIGTTSPTQKLQVEGQCVAEDSLVPVATENGYMAKWLNGQEENDETIQPLNHLTITYVQIKDIKGGEYVLSLNEQSGQFEWQKVEKTLDKGFEEVYELVTETGKKIETTGNHPYLVKESSLSIGKIKEQDGNQKQTVKNGTGVQDGIDVESHFGSSDNFIANSKDIIAQGRLPVKSLTKSNNVLAEPNPGETKIIPNQTAERLISNSERTASRDLVSKLLIRYSLTEENHSVNNTGETWTKVIYLKEGMEIAAWDSAHLGGGIRWERIISIKPTGRRHVYDLQIANTHNFVANGIIAHNTYLKGADQLSTSFALRTVDSTGADKFAVTNAGNVGIGTTNPSQELEVAGDIQISGGDRKLSLGSVTTTNSGIYFHTISDQNYYIGRDGVAWSGTPPLIAASYYGWQFKTSNTDRMRIDSSGNVGIGTTNPKNALDVSGSVAFGSLPTTALPIANSAYFSGNVGIGTTGPKYSLDVNGQGRFVSSASYLGVLISDGVGGHYWNALGLDTATGTKTILNIPNTTGSQFVFTKGYSSGAPDSPLVTILGDSGNVGIGTTSPANNLHLSSTASTSLKIETSGTSNFVGIEFTNNDGATTQVTPAAIGIQSLGTTTAKKLYFATGSNISVSNLASLARMTIDSTGNVGIGTTSPGRTLDVNGNFGGAAVQDSRSLTGTQTVTESTKALFYNLINNIGTTDANAYITFNITGVPNTDGTIVVIRSVAQKGITAANRVCQLYIQINGTQISTVFTPNITTASTVIESYIAARSGGAGGAWYIVTGTTTADSADLAEWFRFTGKPPKEGELVSLAEEAVKIRRSDKEYDRKLIGIISTNPHTTMGPTAPDSARLSLTGRVPAVVTTLNGNINYGDPITSSNLEGVGMKATRPGQIVGKALDSTGDWSEGRCPLVSSLDAIQWPEDDGSNKAKPCFRFSDGTYIGKIMVFVNISWHDPDVYLTNTGDLHIVSSTASGQITYDLKDNQGNLITRIGAFSEAVIAHVKAGTLNVAGKLRSGLIEAHEIISPLADFETAKIRKLEVSEKILSPLAVFGTVQAKQMTATEKFVSPVAEIANLSADTIKAKTIEADELKVGKVTAKEIVTEKEIIKETIVISSQLPATSCQLPDASCQLDNDEKESSLTNQLEADSWQLKEASYSAQLQETLKKIDDILGKESTSTSEVSLSTSEVGDESPQPWGLTGEPPRLKELTVYGQTSLGPTGVAGPLTQDGTLVLDNGEQIDNIYGDLYLQRLGRGGLNVGDGKVTIAKDGKLVLGGEGLTTTEMEELEQLEKESSASAEVATESLGEKLAALVQKIRHVFEVINPEGKLLAFIDNTGKLFARRVETEILSPVADKDLVIRLGSVNDSTSSQQPTANSSSQLDIQNAAGESVAGVDAGGKLLLPKTVGEGVLAVGKKDTFIVSSAVSENSRIFVTATTSTGGQSLFVAAKKAGEGFTVAVDREVIEEIKFSWWVVN